MTKAGGGGLVFIGILIIIAGFIILSPVIDWLITVIGLLMIIGGAAVGISGLIKMFSILEMEVPKHLSSQVVASMGQ